MHHNDHCLQTTPLGQFITAHRKGDKGDECTFAGMATIKGNFTVKSDEYTQKLIFARNNNLKLRQYSSYENFGQENLEMIQNVFVFER